MTIRYSDHMAGTDPGNRQREDDGVAGRIGVVYLSRPADGIGLLERFLISYRTHPAGIDHDLIVLLKGYDNPRVLVDSKNLLEGVDYQGIEIPDVGFDLDAYFFAAQELTHEYLCFLNSYSRILTDDWLSKFMKHAEQPGVGLVGATGSYESAVAHVASRRAESRGSIVSTLREMLRGAYLGLLFPGFPNPHLRTTGFVIARSRLISLRRGTWRLKRHAYRFESGHNGMTRQILARGLKALVVDRDGVAYEPRHWHSSKTFRCGGQANLMIADNQTDLYGQADTTLRRHLERLAWGDASRRET